VKSDNHTVQAATSQSTNKDEDVCLIVDGMAILRELMAVKNVKTCKELGASYVKLIDSKG